MLGAPAAAAPVPAPVARIGPGAVAGILEGGVRIWRGIPYAQPPLGALRWRPPLPAPTWTGMRSATAFGPDCVQPPLPPDHLYFDPPARTGEDCLTLNIWSPADAAKAPVIVWIHGGSLRIGGSSSPLFDGAAFARRGILFVSINYRLGVLGWLAHPELSAESPHSASGNYGLLDQMAALRWIQSHIAAFGGDPRNVTIMGESAGALSVSFLLISPLARGSFHKAILQSPNSRAFPDLSRPVFGQPSAEQTGLLFARAAGAPSLRALRAMDADRLVRSAPFVPQGVIDGWSLVEQVVETFDRGTQARVPIIAGFNSGEIRAQRGLLPAPLPSESEYRDWIFLEYGSAAATFFGLYPARDVEPGLLAAYRDRIYGWSAERMVRRQTEAGLPAFLYLFDHCDPAARAQDLCAFHAGELPFLFDKIGPGAPIPPNWPRADSRAAATLSAAMIDYWAAFARDGVPDPAGQAHWRPWADGRAYMRFSDVPVPSAHLFPGMFELHEQWASARRRARQQWFITR